MDIAGTPSERGGVGGYYGKNSQYSV